MSVRMKIRVMFIKNVYLRMFIVKIEVCLYNGAIKGILDNWGNLNLDNIFDNIIVRMFNF